MENQSLSGSRREPLSALTRGLQSIRIERVGGDPITLDASSAQLLLTQEQARVERMQEDWGAICEVFKQHAFYYLSVQGVRLQAQDRVVLFYQDDRSALSLHVIEMEDGRARIQQPAI